MRIHHSYLVCNNKLVFVCSKSNLVAKTWASSYLELSLPNDKKSTYKPNSKSRTDTFFSMVDNHPPENPEKLKHEDTINLIRMQNLYT